MSNQWFLGYDDGKKIGPISEDEAREYVKKNNNGVAWKEGFSDWQPITSISELTGKKNPFLSDSGRNYRGNKNVRRSGKRLLSNRIPAANFCKNRSTECCIRQTIASR